MNETPQKVYFFFLRIKKKKKANTIKREAEVGLSSVNAWKHAVLELRRHLNGKKKKEDFGCFLPGERNNEP